MANGNNNNIYSPGWKSEFSGFGPFGGLLGAAREASPAPDTPRTATEEAMGRDLFQWYMVRSTSSAGTVPVAEIRNKAREINNDNGGPADFAQPTGWFGRWIKVHDIERPVPAEEEYGPDNTYFLYEGSVQCKPPPWRGGADAKTHRLRVGVCVNASGTHKMPLIVVGKAAHPRCFATKRDIEELVNVVYIGDKGVTITPGTCQDFFRKHFIPEVGRRQATEAREVKVLLVVPDKAASQASSEEHNVGRFKLRLLPRSAANNPPTPQDVVLQGVFARLTLMYQQELCIRWRNPRNPPTVKEACEMLAMAWEVIPVSA